MYTIITLPINEFDRRESENIENSVNLNQEEVYNLTKRGANFFTIDEFTESCNDEVINLDDMWLSYVITNP